jgi:ankyrin repeat protein
MKGCNLQEFKKAMMELLMADEEEKKDDILAAIDKIDKNGKIALIEREFDFSLVGTKGWSILHKACSAGNVEIVEYLLQKK